MKKWAVITILIIVTAVTPGWYFLWKTTDSLNNAQNEMVNLKAAISTLRQEISCNTTDLQVHVSAITDTIDKVEPVAVRIDVTGNRFSAAGSGFIISNDGYLVTNQHVIDGGNSIRVTLMNGARYSATVINSDVFRDIALLKLDSTRKDFPVAISGTSADIHVGEEVMAVGFPLGPELPGPATFTRGIVSAIRTLDGFQYIQTDVTINPGNSGGCIVNLEGKVIGVATSGIEPSHTDTENLGLAIPIDEVTAFIQENMGK